MPQENPYRKTNKTFYPDGTLKTEGDYLYDQLDGHYKEYYPNGALWKDWNYENGKEEGISTWYFLDGKVSIEWSYIYGNKEGVSKWYYETGELWSEQTYSFGVLQGITYTFIKLERSKVNGIMLMECFKEFLKHSTQTEILKLKENLLMEYDTAQQKFIMMMVH